MGYEFKMQDVFDFASTMPYEKKEKGDELFFRYCPYCQGGKNHDQNTFSINLKTGAFNCFRAGCSAKGHFVELARDFHFPLDFGKIQQYRTFPQRKIEVRPKAIEYLTSRGIDPDVVTRYQITTRKDNPNILVFPFYDSNGILRMVKYRNTKPEKGPKEWGEKNAMPILFGMDQCKTSGDLIITEGQIDALSVACCGDYSVVSVPNGAKGFSWFKNCSDWLQQFETIVVFGDCENGKITLQEELQKLLTQRMKVVQKSDYLGEKDANDILRKYGKNAIVYAIEHAQVPKMQRIKDLSEVESINLEGMEHIRTGNTQLDRVIGGFYLGQLVLLSGKRGNGKSTLASQFAAEALEQGYGIFVYSGELPDYHFKRWLDLQLAGPKYLLESENELLQKSYRIKPEAQEKINKWYRGRAYIYDNSYIPSAEEETKNLLDTIKQAVRLYDLKFILIDNLMTAMDDTVSDDIYRAQSKFVGDLKRFAMQHQVVVLLVAHPRKNSEAGKVGNDDVSGSGDITNKVDTVLFFNRPADTENIGVIEITKNRLTGRLAVTQNAIQTVYSMSSKRIYSPVDGANKSYGWEYEENPPDGFSWTQEECPF